MCPIRVVRATAALGILAWGILEQVQSHAQVDSALLRYGGDPH